MNHAPRIVATSLVVGTFASPASAGAIVEGMITADTRYAIYADPDGALARIGGNETGAAGSRGIDNRSLSESWSFEAGAHLYIAAWSDDPMAQGLLAVLRSGDARWEVFATGEDRDTGDPWPEAWEIADHVAFADANDGWAPIAVGDANLASTAPWHRIAGIDAEARWMRGAAANDADRLHGGASQGGMLIFRTSTVPAPGAFVALLGVGLVGARRRRDDR